MQQNDGVINHPLKMKQDLPWKHITGCAEGFFDKRSLVKRCEKTNLESIAGFKFTHSREESVDSISMWMPGWCPFPLVGRVASGVLSLERPSFN